MCHPCWDYILLYIGFTSYGAVGPVQPFTSNCLIFWSFLFRDTNSTNSSIGDHVVVYPERAIQAYSLVTVTA